jgi:HlyD family secretion protein
MQRDMKIWKTLLATMLAALALTACQDSNHLADAYGNFEAPEIIVSAEASGRLLFFELEEGQRLEAGQLVGLVDTLPLHLRRRQLQASIRAIAGKTQEAQPQIEVLQEQKRNLLREAKRLEALVAERAATPKQLDDLRGQIEVLDRQIAATRAQTNTLNRGILAEIAPLEAQLDQVDDQIARCFVYNPRAGTVLLKLAEASEMVAPAKPLYTIARLEELDLRAYLSGAQLPHVQLGQEVRVLIDEGEKGKRELPGRLSWISDQAEFTPKTVQTKEERVNLVYAFKVRVKNDGSLKIGMPGEVSF